MNPLKELHFSLHRKRFRRRTHRIPTSSFGLKTGWVGTLYATVTSSHVYNCISQGWKIKKGPLYEWRTSGTGQYITLDFSIIYTPYLQCRCHAIQITCYNSYISENSFNPIYGDYLVLLSMQVVAHALGVFAVNRCGILMSIRCPPFITITKKRKVKGRKIAFWPVCFCQCTVCCLFPSVIRAAEVPCIRDPKMVAW